jgi:transcriptional regulator with XRE-family HTH domain
MSTRGERLRLAMEARGIRKQQALAFQLGVHESAITRWKVDGSLSLANAIALCDALDISLDWLLLNRGTIESHKMLNGLSPTEGGQLISAFSELSQQMTERTQARLQSFITSYL